MEKKCYSVSQWELPNNNDFNEALHDQHFFYEAQ